MRDTQASFPIIDRDVSLHDLTSQLRRFSASEIGLAELHAWFHPILIADSLDVEESDESPWLHAAEDTRLFWRLVYLFEAGGDEDSLRQSASRIVRCLDSLGDASATYELLPLVLDLDRLVMIVAKHLRGTISRTGFLNVLAQSGYPPHVKLWMERASPSSLEEVGTLLECGSYADVVRLLARPPA